MKSFVMALSLAMVLMVSSSVLAQGYVTFMPVGPVPVAAYYAPAPVVSYGPVVTTSYYAPRPALLCCRAGGDALLRSIAGGCPVAFAPVYGRARDRSPQGLRAWPAGAECALRGDAVGVVARVSGRTRVVNGTPCATGEAS